MSARQDHRGWPTPPAYRDRGGEHAICGEPKDALDLLEQATRALRSEKTADELLREFRKLGRPVVRFGKVGTPEKQAKAEAIEARRMRARRLRAEGLSVKDVAAALGMKVRAVVNDI